MSQLTALDLFSGAGGATAGLKRAGYDVLGAVEVDADACSSYRLNHPTVKLWQADIRMVKPEAMRRELALKPGDLHLLGACPPCQGFSRLRTLNRGAVNDKRNALVSQFARFADAFRPKTLMLENVPSLLDDPRLGRLVKRLEVLGYFITTAVVEASDYGVPQRRRRMILMGSLCGYPNLPKPTFRVKTVRDAIGTLTSPGHSGDPLHDLPERRSEKVLRLIRAVPQNGGSRRDLPPEFHLACHKRNDGFFDVYGRMSWDEVAPTITSGCSNPSKGRFLHPTRHGAITLREAALLQTFPRNYRFAVERGKEIVAAQIGNAFPPELIRRLAKQLREEG